MKRYKAVKLQLHENEWDNADLLTFMYANRFVEEEEEGNESGDGVFWCDTDSEPLSREVFKHADCFEWILNKAGTYGSSKLWYNNKPVTRFNYRTATYSGEGEDVKVSYTYIPWWEMTEEAPIIENENLI